MDRISTRSSTTTTTLTSATSNQIYPFLLGHHLSAYSSVLGADATHHKATQLLPSSTQHLATAHHFPPLASTDGQDGNLHAGFDPAAPVYVNDAKPPEPEYDAYDCESEEGGEASEDLAKPSEPRRSGSKRSRAAEVHNLSEKRRRSRINEKMKALQKLIPNSNKTDKASMLDEVIDYLKQLQLQVQMLSMRNGLTLNPPYLPPALQSLQTSHMRFSSDNPSLLNVGMGMVSLDPSSSSSFGLSNRGTTSSHQTLVPGTSNINDAVVSFPVGSSQSQHGFFHLPAVTSEGIYADEMLHHHLNPSSAIRSGFLHYDGQMHIPNANRIDDVRILNLQECLSMDQTNPIQIQHKQRG